MKVALRAILLGERYRHSLVFGALSVIALCLIYGLIELVHLVGMEPIGPAGLIVLGGIMLICAGTPAYHNNGILPSMVFGAMPFTASRIWYYLRWCGFSCPDSPRAIAAAVVEQSLLISPLLLVGYLCGRLIARTFSDER